MVREYFFNDVNYWVTVDQAFNQVTGQGIFLAFVSLEEPGGLYYGELVRDAEGRNLVFDSAETAFEQAQIFQQNKLEQ